VDGAAFAANTGWVRGYASPRAGHSFQAAFTRQRADDVKYAYLQMDGISDTANRANASYEYARSTGLIRNLSAKVYFTSVEHWMTDQYRLSSIGMAREYSMASQANSRAAGGDVSVVAGPFTYGVEAFLRRSWDITNLMAGMKYAPQSSVPDVRIDQVGGFVEYQRPIGDRTKIEVGGRMDWARSQADAAKANTDLYFAYKGTRRTSATDTTGSGKIRVTHRIGDSFNVNVGFGHTERVVDPQERFFALKRSGTDWVGNPELKPTGNTGATAGLTYNHRRLVVSGSLFYDDLSNYVVVHSQRKQNPVAGVMNSLARSYENVDARMVSAEFSVSYPVTDHLLTNVNASYTRGTKDTNPARNITSTNLSEIHPVMGSIAIRYNRSIYFGEVETMFSGRHVNVDTDLQEEPMPAYGVLGVKAGAQWRAVRVTVAVDNVLDQLYTDHMSYQRDPFRLGTRVREPGRNLYLNVAYRF